MDPHRAGDNIMNALLKRD